VSMLIKRAQDAESVERSREPNTQSPFHPIFANSTFRRIPQRAVRLNDTSEWKIQKYFDAMQNENKSEISGDTCKMFEDLHESEEKENSHILNEAIIHVLPEITLGDNKITKINSRWSI